MKDNETKKLSLEELTTKIKGLISRSALAKIEIGELLNEHTSTIKHGGKKAFYKSIGMSDRTAQYYMKIASNKKIQELKNKGKIDGLNMSRILEIVDMRVKVRGTNNENAPQEQQAYKPVKNFNSEKCRSTRIFKIEYKVLSDKVTELEAKLAEYDSIAKSA